MRSRLIAITAVAIIIATNTSAAMAGLVGMPMNLKFTVDAAHDLTHTRNTRPLGACMIRTDDVLTGPVNA